MNSPHVDRVLLTVLGALLGLFLLGPVAGLVITTRMQDVLLGFANPLVGPALRLSLFTTSISLVLIVGLGLPLSYLLSRSRRPSARWVETLLQLPIVMPPAVAGIALLLAFGQRGFLSGLLYPKGTSAAFSTCAVIMAEVFVSAPFFVRAAIGAFKRIDADLILVARSFGASTTRILLRVAVPSCATSLIAGAGMSWARSLGEFGATLMFAGNLTGRTQTLPLAVYTSLESDLHAARALSALLILVSLALLCVLHMLTRASDPTPS